MYRKRPKGWLKHIDFVLLDLICLEVSFLLAYMVRHNFRLPSSIEYREINLWMLIFDLMGLIAFDNFKNVLKRGKYVELIQTVKNAIVVIGLPIIYMFSIQASEAYSRIAIFLTGLFYVCICYLMRLLWKRNIRTHKKSEGDNRLLVITYGKAVETTVARIKGENYGRYTISGLVLLDNEEKIENYQDIEVVCTADELGYYITRNWVDEVLVCIESNDSRLRDILSSVHETGVTCHVAIYSILEKYRVETFCGYTVLTDSMNYMTITQEIVKRTLDIVGAIVGLLITVILFLFVAPILYISSPGPIFYSQERIGKNGKKFRIYKFRSMVVNADELKKELMEQNKISDAKMFKMDFDPRVIGNKVLPNGKKKRGIGHFIRFTSIDEFPQFWNVLKGDMSLVGTRPPLESEVNEYEARHNCRLSIKPGLTGLWQVSGRSKITDFDQVVELDRNYINNWSIGLDLKILVKTVGVMIHNDGAV